MKTIYIIYVIIFLSFTTCSRQYNEKNKEIQTQDSSFNYSCNKETIGLNSKKINNLDQVPDTAFFELNDKFALKTIFIMKSHLMDLIIYEKQNSQWKEIQRIDSLKSQFGCSRPKLLDFNKDKELDLLIDCGSGARGANQYYYLFIQNSFSKKFNYIHGSSSIPNLTFNLKRNIIEGTYYYGGTSFIDFEIINDSIVEKGGINVSTDGEWTHREYFKTDKLGNKMLIKKDSINDQGHGLFSPK